jgi:hypothetical protein
MRLPCGFASPSLLMPALLAAGDESAMNLEGVYVSFWTLFYKALNQPHSAACGGVGCSGAGNRRSMRRKQALNQTQQRAVERLAKGQGYTCIECGSADYLESDTNAVQSVSNMNVALFCKNPDAEHPEGVLALGKSFPLSFAQAEAIGVTVPPDEPLPRRNPGETAPAPNVHPRR